MFSALTETLITTLTASSLQLKAKQSPSSELQAQLTAFQKLVGELREQVQGLEKKVAHNLSERNKARSTAITLLTHFRECQDIIQGMFQDVVEREDLTDDEKVKLEKVA